MSLAVVVETVTVSPLDNSPLVENVVVPVWLPMSTPDVEVVVTDESDEVTSPLVVVLLIPLSLNVEVDVELVLRVPLLVSVIVSV